jgi:acetate kinase
MRVLVFNCGSSSLKYRLIEVPAERELAGGEAQRVGPRTAEPARIVHRVAGRETTHPADMPDHGAAFDQVMRLLAAGQDLSPDALGHRVVHGGAVFSMPALIDRQALDRLDAVSGMAPIHNPPALALIRSVAERYPDLPQVAVFDTAYHATIPEHARAYALPRHIRDGMGAQRYGFHGTSHDFVAEEAASLLGKPLNRLDAVSCHLGSGGASLCAIVGGRSVDNTMGYSPLQGLMMSTRCGDLDPAVALRLVARAQGDGDAVEALLNRRSGVLGMSGLSADVRDVFAALSTAAADDARPDLTAQAYLWRIRKYLGAYLTVVGRADAVIFTDTIGETSAEVRHAVCADMGHFGLEIDFEKNRAVAVLPADVATPDSLVRALVVATNEELAIARRVWGVLAAPVAAAAGGAR